MKPNKIRWDDIKENFTDLGGTLKIIGPQLQASQMDVYLGRFKPGEGLLPHRHSAPLEEIYYIISGKMTVNLEGNAYEVAQGDVVHVPAGAAHNCINNTSEICEALFVVAPHETSPLEIVK